MSLLTSAVRRSYPWTMSRAGSKILLDPEEDSHDNDRHWSV